MVSESIATSGFGSIPVADNNKILVYKWSVSSWMAVSTSESQPLTDTKQL